MRPILFIGSSWYHTVLRNDSFVSSSLDVIMILLGPIGIIDLTYKDDDPYKTGEKARIKCDLPIFGVLDKLNRKNQKKATESGFDLVFTKSMLLKSIKEIVVHIANDE